MPDGRAHRDGRRGDGPDQVLVVQGVHAFPAAPSHHDEVGGRRLPDGPGDLGRAGHRDPDDVQFDVGLGLPQLGPDVVHRDRSDSRDDRDPGPDPLDGGPDVPLRPGRGRRPPLHEVRLPGDPGGAGFHHGIDPKLRLEDAPAPWLESEQSHKHSLPVPVQGGDQLLRDPGVDGVPSPGVPEVGVDVAAVHPAGTARPDRDGPNQDAVQAVVQAVQAGG
ncbi:MAG TPA: hypothetical protein VM597_13795 [Gemmataceae bacterium]|nr:hypothetical protein [Gemmataceae bacterium]